MSTDSPTTPWIEYAAWRPNARMRMFCLPFAGGNASLYRDWGLHLSKDMDICPIQLPGRERRLGEAQFSHVTPLVESMARALQPYLDKPYVLFGHSMGALIGFELARTMRAIGLPGPQHLFVSGRHAPHRPDPTPPVHNVSDEALISELERLQGTPAAIMNDPELAALFLPMLRADFSINETYEYRPDTPLACAITALGGLEDYKVGREDLLGWQQHTSGRFAARLFPGGHFFVREGARPRVFHAISKNLA